MTTEVKQRRGFACLTPERRREIASKGGSSLKAEQRSFSKSKELASRAGSKGASKRHKKAEVTA